MATGVTGTITHGEGDTEVQRLRTSQVRAAPLVRAKANFTVKSRMLTPKTPRMRCFYCDFGSDSHEWSCSEITHGEGDLEDARLATEACWLGNGITKLAKVRKLLQGLCRRSSGHVNLWSSIARQ